MIAGARYGHTNLIAKDWRALARFYEQHFGCIPVPPERDYKGPDLDRGTGIRGAELRGAHLRLPGHGADGPTLEIFNYNILQEKPGVHGSPVWTGRRPRAATGRLWHDGCPAEMALRAVSAASARRPGGPRRRAGARSRSRAGRRRWGRPWTGSGGRWARRPAPHARPGQGLMQATAPRVRGGKSAHEARPCRIQRSAREHRRTGGGPSRAARRQPSGVPS